MIVTSLLFVTVIFGFATPVYPGTEIKLTFAVTSSAFPLNVILAIATGWSEDSNLT